MKTNDNVTQSNIEQIQAAFSAQAARFNGYQQDSFKTAFTLSMISDMRLTGGEAVLELAAGTCALGRLMAPHVRCVVELDITEAMLDVGRAENEKAGVANAEYVIGNAEELPFEDDSFDVVATRLSFHHFQNPERIAHELSRVLRPGGVAAILDMVPPDETLRDKFDYYEKLRDASHVRSLTGDELKSLLTANGLTVRLTKSDIMPMNLNNWLRLTGPADAKQAEIRDALLGELSGGAPCGMAPYMDNGEIMFKRYWMYVIGEK